MSPHSDWEAVRLSVSLALLTTLILLAVGTPLAWWLSRTRTRIRPAIEALVAMPLVLPPTVLGFYLLIGLGPNSPLGQLVAALGGPPLTFSFTGLVIGSVLYSLPFVVHPLQDAFRAVGREALEAAAVLGASPRDRFISVVLPLARPGFLTASVLGFAHTIGEFGVVLMIGGNIPGETRVLSIALYDHVETLSYGRAHWLAGGMMLMSFLLLVIVYGRQRGWRGGRP